LKRLQPLSLSERESEIIALACEGLTDKEICRKLAISMTTVRTYWSRVRDKLGAANRAQIIAKVVASGGLNGTQQLPTPHAMLGEVKVGAWLYWPEAGKIDLDANAACALGLTPGRAVSPAELSARIADRDRTSFAALLRCPWFGMTSAAALLRLASGAAIRAAVLGPCLDPIHGKGWVFALMEVDEGLVAVPERAMAI
jgi:DNA-binding CsgD family transcriptional regulator